MSLTRTPLFRLITLFILATGLSACAKSYHTLAPGEEYQTNESEAYIIIGFEGSKRLSMIMQRNPTVSNYHAFASPGRKIFVIPVPVGHEFKISRLEIGGTPLQYATISSGTPIMQTNKHALYYYGDIFLNERKVYIKYGPNGEFLKLFKKKYPELANSVKPANFNWQ